MDWWHVALDIRPSSAGAPSGTAKASSSRSPGTESFSIDLAATAPAARSSAAAANQATASKPSGAAAPGSARRSSSSSAAATASATGADRTHASTADRANASETHSPNSSGAHSPNPSDGHGATSSGSHGPNSSDDHGPNSSDDGHGPNSNDGHGANSNGAHSADPRGARTANSSGARSANSGAHTGIADNADASAGQSANASATDSTNTNAAARSTADAAATSALIARDSGANSATRTRAQARASTRQIDASLAAESQQAGGPASDPGADASNAPGLSLLQLLAQPSQGDDSSAPSTDAATSTATGKSDDSRGPATGDPNAVALALLTQALAAALGTSTAAQGLANSTSAASNGATEKVTDVVQASAGSPMRELVALLAQNLAADARSPTDTDPPRSAAAGAKDSPADGGIAATAAAGSNLLAHLGVASQSPLQQAPGLTNTAELKSPPGSDAWSDELGAQLSWMTHRGLESGSLRLSPEHLGPVEVQISVQNGDASVWFGAHHPDTRAALEQALPRLREMFATQGLTLTDSGVSRESPRNHARTPAPHGVAAVSATDSSDGSASSSVRVALGLVDTYA